VGIAEDEQTERAAPPTGIPDDFDPFAEELGDQPPTPSFSRTPVGAPGAIEHISELAGPEVRSVGSDSGQGIPDDIGLLTGQPIRRETFKGATQEDHVPAENQYFRPPKVTREQPRADDGIPEDWDADLLAGPAPPAAPVAGMASTRPPRTVAPTPRAAVPALGARPADGSPLQAFLDGAGLAGASLSEADVEAIMRTLGQIFRETIGGLRDVLMSRTAFKSEFRIERTMVQQNRNNPIKFAAGLDEAMAALLLPAAPGYLPAIEAVREAVDDVKAHQVAVVAGLQEALSALLREFNPERLKKRLEQRSKLANLMGGSKAKYWELYELFYKEVATEAEEGFHGLFGNEFRRAYEKQSRKL